MPGLTRRKLLTLSLSGIVGCTAVNNPTAKVAIRPDLINGIEQAERAEIFESLKLLSHVLDLPKEPPPRVLDVARKSAIKALVLSADSYYPVGAERKACLFQPELVIAFRHSPEHRAACVAISLGCLTCRILFEGEDWYKIRRELPELNVRENALRAMLKAARDG